MWAFFVTSGRFTCYVEFRGSRFSKIKWSYMIMSHTVITAAWKAMFVEPFQCTGARLQSNNSRQSTRFHIYGTNYFRRRVWLNQFYISYHHRSSKAYVCWLPPLNWHHFDKQYVTLAYEIHVLQMNDLPSDYMNACSEKDGVISPWTVIHLNRGNRVGRCGVWLWLQAFLRGY